MIWTSLLRLACGASCFVALAFVAHAHPAAGTWARLTVSLVPGDETLLPRTVHELSNPTSPRYGRYLLREEAAALLEPSPESVVAVTAWLRDAAGLRDHDIELRGQLLHATVSADQSAVLLKRRQDVVDGLSGAQAAADEAVRRHIRAVYLDEPPGRDAIEARSVWHAHHRIHHQSLQLSTSTSGSKYKSTTDSSLASCDSELTPACLRELYQMKNIPTTPNKTILAIIGFNKQTAQRQDLDLFFKYIDPSRAGASFSEASLHGGSNPQGAYPSGEGNLDMQYAVALAAANVDVRFLSVGGMNSDFIPDLDLPKEGLTEPYLAFATALAALPDADLPSVVSISYGVNEQLLSPSYARHTCDIFGQLAARGVSVLAASGDAGPGQSCQANHGSDAPRFLPMFPATCPYVTAVGATHGVGTEESAMELSGGGFSEYFQRPGYQGAQVDAYLAKHGAQWEGLFNPQGRGVPDVAALGQNYQMYNHGQVESANGTSASTPVVAAMIAVLNSLRAEKGKPPLGFLNPWLYQASSFGLTDITAGKSSGCPGTSYAGKASPHIPGAGWPADRGWDAATGLGTPVFSRLRRLASLQSGQNGLDEGSPAGVGVGVKVGRHMA